MVTTKFQLKEGPTSQLSRKVSVLIAGKEVFSWLALPMHIGRYPPTDTELQNSCGWKELDLIQTPCSKHGQLLQVAQVTVQFGFEYFQGWRFYSFSG